MLALFSAPKPFTGQIGQNQRNPLRSWTALELKVQVLPVGDELSLVKTARNSRVEHIADSEQNQHGTPQVSLIIAAAESRSRHERLCYLNADILLLDDFLPSVELVAESHARFRIVGQRRNLSVETDLNFDSDGLAELRERISRNAARHPPAGSDYSVYHISGGLPYYRLPESEDQE